MPYRIRRDAAGTELYLETALSGRSLLEDPMLNKGTAFTEQERRMFGLTGLLPPAVSSEQDQLVRNYTNYKSRTTDLERYQFLTALQDRNETLFYHLLSEHLTEMLPIIYTPVVGVACQAYSRIYHRPRGLYIAIDQQDMLDELLKAVRHNIEVICVTDGERILGLGDLGIGGMGIPIGKLALYTVCAGIHPATTLPIVLDVGTNNRELLDDPLYLGRRHERIRGDRYDAFVEAFVAAVAKRFPRAVLQWEDFAKNNAGRLLERYRDRLCTFNDDIQGTGAVTLAAVMAASAATGTSIAEQRIVLLGAGSAAVGIASQLVIAMTEKGLSPSAARARIWLIDSQGLVHDGRADLDASKRAYAQPQAQFGGSNSTIPSLLEVVRQVRPTVLIGAAAQPGAFDEQVVREMARHVARPVIFPLSNPTSCCEALPEDLVHWTDGRALIATGSPFAPVQYAGRSIPIPQCNNAFIFPGLGLGVLASGASRITDAMFVAAARALSELSPALADPSAPLLPTVEKVREASRHVAFAVAREAERTGFAPAMTDEELLRRINDKMWTPRYLPYRRVL
ncbi:MAG: NAD-dependent malic enzyme [Steroidobacteraceae bacterium]|jgi:malate dehydrogenase (oxaloacetate-decarboxylating)|nr:NAD-dependent malic enzyme [Steroidobacteraceae bacterium]